MTTLEARIAEVLTAHSYAGMDGQYADRCKCGWAGNGDAETAAHQAAMLAPVIAEAQAEAWDAGYTVGNAHNGRRDANPYRATS